MRVPAVTGPEQIRAGGTLCVRAKGPCFIVPAACRERNMLLETKPEIDLHELSPLALAFVGDAVLELLVRARLVGTTRLQPNALHTAATRYVSAKAQFAELAVLEPLLTEQEAAVLRRGKNANKATVAKHATVQEYRASTGLECLLGWLYLRGENARIETLFEALWTGYEPKR